MPWNQFFSINKLTVKKEYQSENIIKAETMWVLKIEKINQSMLRLAVYKIIKSCIISNDFDL